MLEFEVILLIVRGSTLVEEYFISGQHKCHDRVMVYMNTNKKGAQLPEPLCIMSERSRYYLVTTTGMERCPSVVSTCSK
jgi:hypothetical protein